MKWYSKQLIMTFILSLILSPFLIAQSTGDSAPGKKYFYAELIGTQKTGSTYYLTVEIDSGQVKKALKDNTSITDEYSNKRVSFNSMVDALNYMSVRGWEFVQAYTLTIDQNIIYHYVIRKAIDNRRK